MSPDELQREQLPADPAGAPAAESEPATETKPQEAKPNRDPYVRFLRRRRGEPEA